MLYDFVTLTWFDTIPVIFTVISVVLIQLINSAEQLLKTDAITTAATTTNDIKLEKQTSVTCEEKNLTPTSSARNSINLPLNGNIPQTLSFDAADEYHEDEDTLSLENLFPCDQTEIYASKKISFIIDELIQTEANYVNNLRKGIQNYGEIYKRADVPDALKTIEKQQQLLTNIEDILALHEKQILPLMRRNQYDLKQLFDEFATYFDKNHFYCYVIFTMNKKTSMQLRQENRLWLSNYQSEIKDKLGIDSFLVQPIQRLTRYPLLLQQFISEFYKSDINCRPVLMSVCKLETRMRRLLQVVNQAEELPNIEELAEQNITELGNFHKSTEFDAYYYRSRKKYRTKVFLFDRCLLCAEVRKKRLAYRQHYAWDAIEIQMNDSKNATLLVKVSGGTESANGSATGSSSVSGSVSAKEEIEFSTTDGISMKQWMLFVRKLAEEARLEAEQYGQFTLPTEIGLLILFSLWFLWHYLTF